MDTILGICALLWVFVLLDVLQSYRKFTLGLLLADIGTLVLYSAFPHIVASIFGSAAFAGSAVLTIGLSLFIWAASFLMMWLFFTLLINTLSGGR